MILTEYLITKNAHNNIKVAQIDADITYEKYSIQRKYVAEREVAFFYKFFNIVGCKPHIADSV